MNRLAFITSVLTEDIRVSPSGLARATCWLPILPEAPATLSTTTGWPSLGDSFSDTKRAMMSGPVPGVNGTTMRTGWSGQAKAALKVTGAASVAAANGRKERRSICLSMRAAAFNQRGAPP